MHKSLSPLGLQACLALAPFLAAAATAGDGPYDEKADARGEIRAALAAAQESKLPVLVVFGANGCGDCKMLDTAFKAGIGPTGAAAKSVPSKR